MQLQGSEMSPVINFGIDKCQSSESDVKEFRKKMRNRQSAQRARDRQKARMRWLEQEVALLSMRNRALQDENNALRSVLGEGVHDPVARRMNSEVMSNLELPKFSRSQKEMIITPDKYTPSNIPPTYERNSKNPPKEQEKRHTSCDIMYQEKTQTKPDNMDRVAVISPIKRPHSHFQSRETKPMDFGCTPSKQNKSREEGVKNMGERVEDRAPVKSDNKDASGSKSHETKGEQRGDHKELHSLPFTGSLVSARFPGPLMLPSGYASACNNSIALASLFPRITPNSVSHGTDEMLEQRIKQEQALQMLKSANAISSILNSENRANIDGMGNNYTTPYGSVMPFSSTSIPTSFLSSMPMLFPYQLPLETSNITGSNISNNQKLARDEALKRFKMNSFESECSSQLSSESDMSSHSP